MEAAHFLKLEEGRGRRPSTRSSMGPEAVIASLSASRGRRRGRRDQGGEMVNKKKKKKSSPGSGSRVGKKGINWCATISWEGRTSGEKKGGVLFGEKRLGFTCRAMGTRGEGPGERRCSEKVKEGETSKHRRGPGVTLFAKGDRRSGLDMRRAKYPWLGRRGKSR